MSIVALIDGGGSKTCIRFIDRTSGVLITETVAGPSNLGLGAEACWLSITQACDIAKVVPSRYIAGMAGTEYVSCRSTFLDEAPAPLILVSDRDSGLFGANFGYAGGCLTVGTGVSFAWLDDGLKLYRRGGLGFILGDQGGGAWLGRRVLQELAQLSDRGLLEPLHCHLIHELDIGDTCADWMQFAKDAKPVDFSVLAKVVVTLSSEIPLCDSLVQEGASALTAPLIDFPRHLPVALVGGLAKVYEPRLRAFEFNIVQPLGDALNGLDYIDQHLDELTIEYWKHDV